MDRADAGGRGPVAELSEVVRAPAPHLLAHPREGAVVRAASGELIDGGQSRHSHGLRRLGGEAEDLARVLHQAHARVTGAEVANATHTFDARERVGSPTCSVAEGRVFT